MLLLLPVAVADKITTSVFYDSFIMSRLKQGLGLLFLTAVLTIPSWMYYKQYGNYAGLNQLSEVARTTNNDPVISALRDVGISDETDCRRLFGKQSSAHGFNMSEDFQENIAEFLSAVRVNAGVHEDIEGNSYSLETQYKLLHYLVTNLKFVRTVCETGMNAISPSTDAQNSGVARFWEPLCTPSLLALLGPN